MKEPVPEAAVFSVNEGTFAQFLKYQSAEHAAIKRFSGFSSLHKLRPLDSPLTFVDYCEWETNDDAKNSNQHAVSMPEPKNFFELGDGLNSFGQYRTGRITQ